MYYLRHGLSGELGGLIDKGHWNMNNFVQFHHLIHHRHHQHRYYYIAVVILRAQGQ